MPTTPCDWKESVHGKAEELTPHDAPIPLGNHVVIVIHHDINMFQNFISR